MDEFDIEVVVTVSAKDLVEAEEILEELLGSDVGIKDWRYTRGIGS
jgi:hypothetical protein